MFTVRHFLTCFFLLVMMFTQFERAFAAESDPNIIEHPIEPQDEEGNWRVHACINSICCKNLCPWLLASAGPTLLGFIPTAIYFAGSPEMKSTALMIGMIWSAGIGLAGTLSCLCAPGICINSCPKKCTRLIVAGD